MCLGIPGLVVQCDEVSAELLSGLVELRRVLRPSSPFLCAFTPPSGGMKAGLIGLFTRAGFTDVELSLQPEVHGHGSPGFEPWVRNIIGNVRSGERGLVESGLAAPADIARAVSELEALLGRRDASAIFAWNRAAAAKS